MVFNRYAAGNKVYRGGSSAATSGHVDPMGYIERELNKRGKMRSGWAQAAMSRMKGRGGPVTTKWPGNPLRPKAPVKAAAAKKAAPNPNNKQIPNVNKQPDRGYTPPGQSGPSSTAPAVNDGQLTSITAPTVSSASGQITLNPALMVDQTNAQDQYNQTELELANDVSNINNQYAIGQRDLGQQQVADQRGDLNNFSGRGLAFSSGYGQEVADSAQQFQNAFSDLLGQKQAALAQNNLSHLSNSTTLQGILRALAAQQAQLNTQQAGTLGLDPNYKDPAGAPLPGPVGSVFSGMQTSVGNNNDAQKAAARALFLKNHPILASLQGQARNQFLKNHPEIAKKWEPLR